MISYVLPTRNRPDVLRATLRAIERLGPHPGGAEVIVVDNASGVPVRLERSLRSGVSVEVVRRPTNEGAAARNLGVLRADPASEWIVMLDDDSAPLDLSFVSALAAMPREVGAVSADIFLGELDDDARAVLRGREQGGLPEVFIGCGVALRRTAFTALGGYDAAFGYYAEEYDLAARLMLSGMRTVFEPRFRVLHRKVSAGRDMNTILARLVRNNAWVLQRYAPESERRDALRAMRRRYRAIAHKEGAIAGFGEGLRETRETIRAQQRTPMSRGMWRRFIGAEAAREGLSWSLALPGVRHVALVDRGKNADVISMVLRELGIAEVDAARAQRLVVGTLSPGPMLDALERWRADPRVVSPVRLAGEHWAARHVA